MKVSPIHARVVYIPIHKIRARNKRCWMMKRLHLTLLKKDLCNILIWLFSILLELFQCIKSFLVKSMLLIDQWRINQC